MYNEEYDVVVVGGGHAGAEAAAAASKLGSKTLLITMSLQTIAQMSCNPAMGGVAKGQIVREIDALGGLSGIVSDLTAIQFKMLNKSKGPAMWSPRVQSDRVLFSLEWRKRLEQIKNLHFFQASVIDFYFEKEKLRGVFTNTGTVIKSKSVVLTAGTFLNGLIHVGDKKTKGGRAGESPVGGLTKALVDIGFDRGRMKTGTPPRVDSRSINYSVLEEQKGDENPSKFSFSNETKPLTTQKSCHIAYTNKKAHEIIKEGFSKSPVFLGKIKGTAPRYCPSVEDKVFRFSQRERHQLFIEPEGWNTIEVYVNGFSTSLPEDIQHHALSQVKGFENVRFFRPGYAVEYDYFPPNQLSHTLETKKIKGLFFAGQINGTTGYEEAAAQGLLAGINAHLSHKKKAPFVLKRDEAYIGVLIDDLVTKGTEEPYRMFTSRAEFRILLRQDNADIRLTPKAYKLGLQNKERMIKVENKEKETKEIIDVFRKTSISPEEINSILETKESAPLNQKTKIEKVLLRPNLFLKDIVAIPKIEQQLTRYNEDSLEQAEIAIKYSGYIEKEKEKAEKLKDIHRINIPKNIDYFSFSSLSSEAKEKLEKNKPKTLFQASMISGVSPSDISVLLVFLKKNERRKQH